MIQLNLFKNLPFKILSLLLAVSFWFFLVIFQNVIYDLKEPLIINVLNTPTGLEIASPLPEVTVRVTAPKEDTAFLRAQDFRAEINLDGRSEGEHVIAIKVETDRENVNIVSYVPREVVVSLEETETRSFAVRAEIIGEPADNFALGEALYNPRKATVKGPLSIVESISYIGHKIELTGSESGNIKNVYTLAAYGADGREVNHGLKITPDTVVTELQILRRIFEKSVPISVKFAPDVDTARINEVIVDPPTVTVRGSAETLSTLESVKTEPLTASDIETIITGGEFFAKLVVSQGLTLDDADQKITVEIK